MALIPQTFSDLKKENCIKRAVSNANAFMRRHRGNRRRLLAHVAGSMYLSDNERNEWMGKNAAKMPLNLLHQTNYVMAAVLLGGTRRVDVSTEVASLEPAARVYEAAIEKVWKANRYQDDSLDVLTDAMSGLGCWKIGVGQPEHYGRQFGHSPGGIFNCRVDMDDLVLDPNSRGIRNYQFVGDQCRHSFDEAAMLDGMNVDLLRNAMDRGRASQVARLGWNNPDAQDSMIEDWVDILHLYIVRDRVIVSMTIDGQEPGQIVGTTEWQGLPHGPYEFLSFNPLPNNSFPIPPLSVLFDLNDAINMQMRKMLSQIARAKTIYAGQMGMEDDGVTVRDAADGTVVFLDDPKSVAPLEYRGPGAEAVGIKASMQSDFSQLAGNMDLIVGTGASAKTLGQSQMLAGSISSRLQASRAQISACDARVAEQNGFWLKHDPTIEHTVQIEDMMGDPMEVTYNAQAHEGDFSDYSFGVTVSQEPAMDQQTRFGRIMQFIVEAVPAAYQAQMVSQGEISARKIIRNIARRLDIEDDINSSLMDPENAMRQMIRNQGMRPQPQAGAQPMRTMDYGGQGQLTGPGGSSAQMGGGHYDQGTVANGRYSPQAMSGSTLGASQAGRARY